MQNTIHVPCSILNDYLQVQRRHERSAGGMCPQVTVLTHLDGSRGFLVYVDGNLAASLPSTDPKALNATLDNVNLLLDGGRPIFLQVPSTLAASLQHLSTILSRSCSLNTS